MLGMARYYSNGLYRDDSRNPPDRGNDDFNWWYSSYELPPPQNFDNVTYNTDPIAIIVRRELFRRMGGKPANAAPAQMAEWKRESAQLAYFMGMEPCGAFASSPKTEEWNYQAWAAFANWYWFLDPKYRWELLQDIIAGHCNRWMPVVLEMRKSAPPDTLGDPTYAGGDRFLVQENGDDPARVGTKANTTSAPPVGSDWHSPCTLGSLYCFGGD
jgi:hypothetical protein